MIGTGKFLVEEVTSGQDPFATARGAANVIGMPGPRWGIDSYKKIVMMVREREVCEKVRADMKCVVDGLTAK